MLYPEWSELSIFGQYDVLVLITKVSKDDSGKPARTNVQTHQSLHYWHTQCTVKHL